MDIRRTWILGPLTLFGLAALSEATLASPGLAPGLYLPSEMKCSDADWMSIYGNSEDVGPWFIEQHHRFARADKARVSGAASFVADGTRYRLCPDASLKPDARMWPKALHKPRNGLPIKPGLYRAFVLGRPNDANGEGCGTTGYVLFEPTRYAWIGDRGNEVQRLRGVRQVGPWLFELTTGTEMNWPFFVLAPDRFSKLEGECGKIEFRPANPRSVPRARMPHW